jgi:uncharacterized protein
MKLELSIPEGHLFVRAYQEGRIRVGHMDIHESCILLTHRVIPHWRPQRFEDLRAEDLAALADHAPEIILLGTGARSHFPPQAWLAPLIAIGIGVEVMDTGAACRCFNLLAADERQVAAAILMIH